jgi:hypothetical protein
MSVADGVQFAALDDRVRKLERLVDSLAGEVVRLQERVEGKDMMDEIMGPAPVAKPKKREKPAV